MSTPAKRSARNVALAWAPALAYMALIWFLSSAPRAVPLDVFPFKDKGAHALEYGILAVLNVHALRGTFDSLRGWKRLLGASLLTFAWGYLDEVHQAFVPGRNADAYDLLADTIGGCLGSAAALLVARLRRGPS